MDGISTTDNLRVSITHALKWSFLSEIASKAIQPLVFVVLARLLTPDDYGVVAAAAMVISFSQIFWEAGMGKAIIQYQGDRAAAANVAFWINNVLGVVVAGMLVAISGGVADRVFHDPRVALVLQVMALQVFLSASAAVHVALLQKDMQFKHLFWVRLATVAVPGLASIPLAWYGMGYWALVAGALVGQTVQVAILWKTSPWRPHWCFDWEVAKQLGRFGGWVAASGLLAWFYTWADSLIVGMYLGSHELGLYRTGNAFVAMIYGFLFGPLMPVLYSHLSSINNDRHQLNLIVSKAGAIFALISLPFGLILFELSNEIEIFIFGPNWVDIAIVIAILGVKEGLLWPISPFVEGYRAGGRPDIETKINAFGLIAFLVIYLWSIKYGLVAFLWSRLFVGILGLGINLYFMKFVMRLSLSSFIRTYYRVLFVVVFTGLVFLMAANNFQLSAFYNLLMLATSLIVLLAVIYRIEKYNSVVELKKCFLEKNLIL